MVPITKELTTKETLDLDKRMDVEEAVEDFEEHADNDELQGPTIEISPASISGDLAEASLVALTADASALPSPLESSFPVKTQSSRNKGE
ncbi:hypothetical protein H0H87_001877 [Tephrocybe sp. NHM501043]|nr:hypothetical protein H0H87_001877 [Tephrocybe sp. NHM501043]